MANIINTILAIPEKLRSTLAIETLIERFEGIRKGTYHNIEFYSIPKTINGETIYKVASTEIQAKIDHTHSKNYEEPTYHRHEDSEYLVDNAIKLNNKTGNYLVTIVPKWDTYKTEYLDKDGNPISEEYAKSIIKPTIKKSEKPPVMITPKATNILSIH